MSFQPHATAPLPQGKGPPLLHSIGDWVGFRVSPEVSEKRKISYLAQYMYFVR